MKRLLSLILFLPSFWLLRAADSDWRIHLNFDEEVTHVIETPDYVYFTSRRLPVNNNTEALSSLFRYDKKGEELLSLSTSNILNGNTVRDIIYNPAGGYLAVLYKDYNIDLLYNNGKVINIPYYAQSSFGNSKNVNSMTIDKSHDRIYLATDFGYLAINDKKHEVAESRNYSVALNAFARLGDRFLILTGGKLLTAQADNPRLSLNQYEELASFNDAKKLYPLSDNICILVGESGTNTYVKILTFDDEGIKSQDDLVSGDIYNIENTTNGVTIATGNILYQVDKNGNVTMLNRPDNYNKCAAVTLNMSDVWNGLKRKGLNSIKKSGDQWNVTRDWMLPNSPAPFVTTSFGSNSQNGLLMLSFGATNPSTASLPHNLPMLLSGYKDGKWTQYAPAYTNPDRTTILTGTTGMAVDPDNSNYVYVSSYHNGFARFNLSNPQDIIHYTREGDPGDKQPGFVPLEMPKSNAGWTNISTPYFDNRGNLWMSFPNWENASQHPHLYCLLAEDRRATTSASNARAPKIIEFNSSFANSNYILTRPLLYTGNGLHVYHTFENNIALIGLLNTNGTPADTSDDKVYKFPEFVDSDGNPVSFSRVNFFWEDPSTGYVWFGHSEGLFYFIPSQVIAGNYELYRPKVARNDGSNLADYLLDAVRVNAMTQDNAGRKWFATGGGGVVCTSNDGREIIEEFTKTNSPLPSDFVYGIAYHADTNSLMISTDEGYAEYNLPSNQSTSEDKTDIKAYPNPVRPDYSGYVTITDIPAGSFVKITDIAGNLVKELGIMNGFEILWDISDTKFNRVKSGVYHIMVSPSGESGSFSGVGKILVMN